MTANKFFVPRTGYENIERVIIAYSELGGSVSRKELLKQDPKLSRAVPSKANAFLIEIGVIEGQRGDDEKLVKDLGNRLGLALKYANPDEIRNCWREVIRGTPFLNNLVLKLVPRGEVSEDELLRYIYNLSGIRRVPKDVPAGARAIVKILVDSGYLTTIKEKYQVTKDTRHLYEQTSPLVFVIMALRPEMDPVFAGIESAAKKVDLNARRVVDVIGDYRITDQIISMIRTAKFIICDLTYERPNVYFELGFARGLGKTVITIVRDGTNVHFDVKDWTYIQYSDSRILETKLLERFEHELEAQEK